MEDLTENIMVAQDVDAVNFLLSQRHSEMQKKQTANMCNAKYKKDIENITDWLGQMKLAQASGTQIMEIGSRTKPVDEIIENLEYAIGFLSSPPQSSRKPIIWDEMPDLLSDDELSAYFGLAIPTIQSKRSRSELPKLNALGMTPKSLLMQMSENTSVAVVSQSEKKEKQVQAKIATYKAKK